MKKPLDLVYKDIKSLYMLDYIASLAGVSAFTGTLVNSKQYDDRTIQESFELLGECMELLEQPYRSIPKEMIRQPHLREFRKVNSLLPGLKRRVEYIKENYDNPGIPQRRMERRAKSVYRRVEKLVGLSRKIKERVHLIEEELGIEHDLVQSMLNERYHEKTKAQSQSSCT
jgi:hypothetical protein